LPIEAVPNSLKLEIEGKLDAFLERKKKLVKKQKENIFISKKEKEKHFSRLTNKVQSELGGYCSAACSTCGVWYGWPGKMCKTLGGRSLTCFEK